MLERGLYQVEQDAQQSIEPRSDQDQDEEQDQQDQTVQRKNCYKVLTCDINDDIIPLQGSLMTGVARQAAIAHQKQTEHYKNRPLGILDD